MLSDPVSGFRLVRGAAIQLTTLRLRGFKVLLEILLGGRRSTTGEVGYRFGERRAGDSKAPLPEAIRHVRRLIELCAGPLLVLFVSVRSMKLATANVLSLLVLGGVCLAIADAYARGPEPAARSVRKLLRRRDLGPPAV